VRSEPSPEDQKQNDEDGQQPESHFESPLFTTPDANGFNS
jgi:hypothetical protein